MGVAMVFVYLTAWSTHTALGTWIARGLPRERSTFIMYATAAILGILLAVVSRSAVFEAQFLLVSFIGGYQAYVGYVELYALRYNLTLTSVVLPLRFVLAALLAAIFLGEAELYKNPWMATGGVFLFVATIMFRKGEREEGVQQVRERGTFKQWLIAISVMIFLAGTAGFGMKYAASEMEMPRLVFPSYWYPAAAVFIAPVLLFNRKENFSDVRLTKRDLAVPVRGATALSQTFLEFVVYQSLSLAVAAPALALGTTIVPVVIGLLGFAERKEVTRLQLLALGIGFVGALLLVVARI